ncbi:MetQ/NlpA family ABC transporter substrate-binding protein [Agrococcus sp. ARC_14]|uniref:MetQ/NlpA family ABC transporter substrate-binding protein n=1 Tax=Agrococcus sp. ARC_14 TaxID=2919927 RepID=UPI001F0697A0|nr:MetQ/NlpA family ABC transporter substrate-binding protein [Agrococcus sp. ARC_14]MCH1883524.1 MetQ/NlpA family ABC transporter substrate-binding protein [Agrococcus sp. ARC_14]
MTARSRHALLALTAAGLALSLAACAAPADDAASDTVTIRVAATVTPMTDAVEAAAEVIEEGYEVELVPVNDYVQPNVLLQHSEIDANVVQFEGFMEDFNAANDADLVVVQPVYATVVAFYSQSLTDLQELPQGGSIAIPNDRSNAGRALQLLAEEGIIELDPAVEPFQAGVADITANPRELEITQIDLLQLNTAYDEMDAVFNLPSFARQLGLTPAEDGLAVEQDPAFEVSLVTRADNADAPEIAALTRALTSDHVREVLEELGVPAAF